MEYIFIFNAAFAGISFAVFAIGMSLILMTATKDLKYGLESLNQSVKNKGKWTKIFNQFAHIVQLHAKSKQLSFKENSIFFNNFNGRSMNYFNFLSTIRF